MNRADALHLARRRPALLKQLAGPSLAEPWRAMDPTRTRVNVTGTLSGLVPGLRIESNPNKRGHWGKGHRTAYRQKQAVALWLASVRDKLPPLPVQVEIVRLYAGRERRFDDDNFVAGCKAARDQIAEAYGVTDADPNVIRFECDQQRADELRLQPGTWIYITPQPQPPPARESARAAALVVDLQSRPDPADARSDGRLTGIAGVDPQASPDGYWEEWTGPAAQRDGYRMKPQAQEAT